MENISSKFIIRINFTTIYPILNYNLSHFKTNKWFSHIYIFNIKIENDTIITSINVIGKDKFVYSKSACIE